MKLKRLFAVLLACICLCSMTVAVKAEPSSPYHDVSTSFWGYEDVLFVTDQQLMMGVDVGSFAPNMTLSRGMLATVLWRVEGSPAVTEAAPFTDLTQDWYKMPVAWAAKNGIVNGVGDGRFAPENDITREQLVVMLYRYTESCNYVMEGSVALTHFKDQATVSSWATEAMKWGVGNGLINGMEDASGNPILAPTATCTRAQAAAMIHRYMLKEWEPIDSGENNTPGDTTNPGDNTGSGDDNTSGDPTTPNTEITTPGNDTEAGNFARYASNPILLTNKPANTGYTLSYDIDTTGFLKNNVKLTDLQGKTLTILTGGNLANWGFWDEDGEWVTEFDWLDACEDTYGVKIKYINSSFNRAEDQARTYMNAGKTLDILLTYAGGFPKYLNLSQALDPYIDVNNKGNSPGVSEMTLEQTKWGGSYRCIAPVGAANVLWYNQSMVHQFNLLDPYTLWKQGNWDWDAYEAFMMSVPKNTVNGETLYAFRQDENSVFSTWSVTNGKGAVEIYNGTTPELINNWNETAVKDSWSFISKVFRKINYADAETALYGQLFTGDTVLMSETGNTLFPQIDSTPYGAANQFQWVPFPESGNADGKNAAFAYGCTMMLPKRMKEQDNAPYAVKFMELWANRFTEALYDYYGQDSSIGMNDVAKRRHYDFCLNNTWFSNQMNDWSTVTGDDKLTVKEWQTAFSDPSYDLTAKTAAMRPIVNGAIEKTMDFGSEIV